jgi:hypothetical protein
VWLAFIADLFPAPAAIDPGLVAAAAGHVLK